jgi:hypothetical protein
VHFFDTLPLFVDAGMPMIFLTFPLMAILFIPTDDGRWHFYAAGRIAAAALSS